MVRDQAGIRKGAWLFTMAKQGNKPKKARNSDRQRQSINQSPRESTECRMQNQKVDINAGFTGVFKMHR